MAVYQLTFPDGFDLSDLVQPEPVMSADGHWYFVVYGKLSQGASAKTYVCRWKIGQAVVEFAALEQYCSARGSPASDGSRLWLMAHDSGKRLCMQTVPDFVPPHAGRAAVPIPPGGAIDSLFDGVYTAADFDTPAETALRVQKQLDAIQELVALLQAAGVLRA